MRKCSNCDKTSLMAGTRHLLRGHYNPTNWSRKYPNLQKATLPDGTRALICTKCIKRFAKTSAPRKTSVVASAPKTATITK